ncbi:cytochrome P450 [Mycena rosella]|uniref:Cytochrome P450 n=1 Tax=Mycena rosella TaxID=1033263 RepID=A0AAD7GVR7_MYCRO|nr:cytochrome P450 [Mycena rosella]
MHTTALLYIFWILLFSIAYFRRMRMRARLPPGLPGLFLIGNIRDVSHNTPQWLTYKHWAETYGDIIYIEVFGSRMIILNSLSAVTQLLEKRSANYSDRPPMHMVNDLMSWDWDLAHMRYSDWWRLHRKTFHQYFQPRAVPGYYPIQMQATRTLLQQLSRNPARFADYVRQHAGNIILRVAYGYEIKPENDPYVSLAHEAAKGLIQAANAGSFLVDFLPILKHVPSWFPGASFKRKAKIWAKSALELRDSPFEALKESIAAGTAISSFAADNLEKMRKSETPLPDQEVVIKNCASIAYLAGSDTTVSVVLSFILAMVLYPDVQAKAREEIDAAVGNRLPDFSDRPSLPYVNAILDETLRWGPVAPLALPHMNVSDDEYNGFYIPAGTTIVGNAYAILHNETMFPQPHEFKPERFIPQEGKEPPLRPESVAFGFGRRICPGRYLALDSAWIAIVSILKTYNIDKALDADGKYITPEVDYTVGIVSHPKPFKCSFTIRSEALELV